MKLYYSPGACSLSPHIVLEELGLPYESEKVDLKAKKTESGQDYNTISPKGSVPLLVLDNGEQVTEGAVIVQYLADQKPEANLAGKAGSLERVRVQEWLNFIGADLHKTFIPFIMKMNDETKDAYRKMLTRYFGTVEKQLEKTDFLTGANFSVADAYLYVVSTWVDKMNTGVTLGPKTRAFQQRMEQRPAVQRARQQEGLDIAKAA